MPMPLYSPAAPRRLCAVPRPAGGIFAPVSGRAELDQKQQTAVKAICSPYTAFHCLSSISIFPHRKTAHRGRQRPAQGIKQPRPAPSWSKPGSCYISPRPYSVYVRPQSSAFPGAPLMPAHQRAPQSLQSAGNMTWYSGKQYGRSTITLSPLQCGQVPFAIV